MEITKNSRPCLVDNETKLKSIIDLTANKDYVLLTRTLIKKLKNIQGVHKVNLYEVYGNIDNKSTKKLLLKDVLDILSTLIPFYQRVKQYPSPEQIKSENYQGLLRNDIQQTVFPIHNIANAQRILVIDWQNINPENWSYVLSLLKVYSNLLKIIDEKDRDQLTGLLNRHTFDNNLENIINHSKLQSKKARNNDKNSWIAILDIDHFKQVNDKYGHLMGDEVLLLFSRLMLSEFRYSDILFRFGGEEFIIVLTGCDRKGAETALNRFRKTIETYRFPQVGKITVSAGYIFLDSIQSPNTLLDHADQALYYAKETGRNKVVYYNAIASILDQVSHINNIEIF
ncbi:MAG: diguanylate cyclase [Methylococcaceae bacterium]|nr:diguanylate cyclase [Methylococcaceae bacterium]